MDNDQTESAVGLLDAGPSHQEQVLATLAHVLGLMTSVVGPTIIYYLNKDKSKFIRFHALQAAMFQLAIFVLLMISKWIPIFSGGIFYDGILIADFAGVVLAALAANKGEWYELPVVGPWVSSRFGM